MPDTNRAGAILIREDTPLPANLLIESEAFLPGWRVVKNLDRSTLARNIEGASWNFFYLAGEIRATVLGRGRPGTLRKAVKCVLAKQEGPKFNSLEITKVVSKRFLGIPSAFERAPAIPSWRLVRSSHTSAMACSRRGHLFFSTEFGDQDLSQIESKCIRKQD